MDILGLIVGAVIAVTANTASIPGSVLSPACIANTGSCLYEITTVAPRAGQDSASDLSRFKSPSARVSTAKTYTIKQGDTLWDLTWLYGLDLDAILEANGLKPNSYVAPGTEIKIPYTNEKDTVVAGPNGPVAKGKGLHFVASNSTETCWLFFDSTVVSRWTCSTGRPESPSIPGNYTIQSKILEGYFKPAESYMPYWLGLYTVRDVENGIHGFPYSIKTGEKMWTDMIGTPITFGCVMLSDPIAKQLYEIAYIGMPVTILP